MAPPRDAALTVAQEALNRIDKHEAVCNVRWGNIAQYMQEAKEARQKQHEDNLKALSAVKTSVTGLYDWRFKAACALVLGLATAVVSLCVYIYTNGGH